MAKLNYLIAAILLLGAFYSGAQAQVRANMQMEVVEEFESQQIRTDCMERSGNRGCYQVNIKLPDEDFLVAYTRRTLEQYGPGTSDLLIIVERHEYTSFTIPSGSGASIEINHREFEEYSLTHHFPSEDAGLQVYFNVTLNERMVMSERPQRVHRREQRLRQPLNIRELSQERQQEERSSPVEEESTGEEIFDVENVDEEPVLIGGFEELQSRVNYPEEAREAGIEGIVVVEFVITESGRVEDPVVVRSIGGGADEEAIRVIEESEFEPARKDGDAVRSSYSLQIYFRADE